VEDKFSQQVSWKLRWKNNT